MQLLQLLQSGKNIRENGVFRKCGKLLLQQLELLQGKFLPCSRLSAFVSKVHQDHHSSLPATDERFYRCVDDDGLVSIEAAKRCQEFLRIIKQHVDGHLLAREGRRSHYEDLYAAVMQIVQDETAEITNPLIAHTVETIKAASAHLYVGGGYHIDDNRFASLADRSVDLIQWVVYHNLNPIREPLKWPNQLK